MDDYTTETFSSQDFDQKAPGDIAVAAREFVVRRNRTVQRATIYPKGHPAARQALTPFLTAGLALFQRVRHVSVLVSREQLFVACDSLDPAPVDVPWLSARLADRGLASFEFIEMPSADDALDLVTWLGKPASDDSAPRTMSSVSLTWKDYSLVRFTEAAAPTEENADALMMWQSVTHGLTTDWVQGIDDGPTPDVAGDGFRFDGMGDDPLDLAKFVRRALIAQEGTGITSLANTIVAAGGRLATLDDTGRAIVRRKLGAFIGELAPELRGQLLKVVPTDSPEKIDLLTQVIDELPRAVVLDVMQNMQIGRSARPQRMVSLLTKMVSLSASDPDLTAAVGSTLARSGLPSELATEDTQRVQQALEILLSTPIDDASVSADYKAQLDALADAPAERPVISYDDSRFLLPTSVEQVGIGTAKIAVASLAATPLDADTTPLLLRTRGTAVSLMATADLDGLIELACVVSAVIAAPGVEEAEVAAARSVLALFEEAPAIELFLAAVSDVTTPLPDGIEHVLRAGALPMTTAALRRLSAYPAGTVHDRLLNLLCQLEASSLAAAVKHARATGHLPVRVVVELLAHDIVRRDGATARTLLDDPDPGLRLQAYRAAFELAMSQNEFDRLLRQALDDPDDQIVALAFVEARAKPAMVTVRVLGQFLARPVPAARVQVQVQAITALAQMGTPGARSALVAALTQRGRAWDRASRLVARRLADQLERFGDETSRSAARGWRRSPVGLVTLVLRERMEAA